MGTKGIVGQAEQASPQAADKRVGSQGTDGVESAERTGTSRAHTAGEWSVYDQAEDDGPGFPCYVRSSDPESDWIAQDIYNRADAHLISAAPEMLEALRAARAYILRHPAHDGWTLTMASVDVALAKAEGGRQ